MNQEPIEDRCKLNWAVYGILRSIIKNKKPRSSGSVADLLLLALDHGRYTKKWGKKVGTLLDQMFGGEWIRTPNGELSEKMKIMVQDAKNWEARGRVRSLRMKVDSDPEWVYRRLKEMNIEHVVTDSFVEGSEWLRKMCGDCEYPLYLDTEGSYWTLPSGETTALISIYDWNTNFVLIWRIHRMTRSQVSAVKRQLSQAAQVRGIFTYGPEKLLKGIKYVVDLQFWYSGKSLKEAVQKTSHCWMDKSETLSNWITFELRMAQISYAAMDAIVIHSLLEKSSLFKISGEQGWRIFLYTRRNKSTRPSRKNKSTRRHQRI